MEVNVSSFSHLTQIPSSLLKNKWHFLHSIEIKLSIPSAPARLVKKNNILQAGNRYELICKAGLDRDIDQLFTLPS